MLGVFVATTNPPAVTPTNIPAPPPPANPVAVMEKYQFDPNKFKVVGNGWDNPLPGCTDPSNADNNKKNRRVEVKVFPLESGS